MVRGHEAIGGHAHVDSEVSVPEDEVVRDRYTAGVVAVDAVPPVLSHHVVVNQAGAVRAFEEDTGNPIVDHDVSSDPRADVPTVEPDAPGLVVANQIAFDSASHEAVHLDAAALETRGIVTAEEHTVVNGVGAAVAAAVAEEHPVPVEMVGVRDTFGESGDGFELLEKYGLNAAKIVEAARKVMRQRGR